MLNIDKPVVSPSETSNILPINGSRNIILCFDGTTNHFGPEKITNVIRVFELLSKDANRQLCYYQAGIGSYDTKVPLDSQTSSVSSQISKTFDAAFANGIRKHILGGYKYLMANYKQGDVIYMFGFSRGAYTARVLCGMLDKVGLLISGNEEQVSFAWKMYRGVERKGHHRKGKKQDPELLATDFGRIYSQKVNVHFIGIWDTVRSAGLWRDPNLPEASDGFIRHFYHALALDERRAQFRPTLYSGNISIESPDLEKGKRSDSSPKPTTKTEVVELWFPGDHCDVGGRFTFDDRTAASLANPSFRWIVRSAAMLAKDPGLSFNFDAMLKYYDILFYNTPEKMVQVLPSETEWFRQDLVTFPIDEVWSTELDFLCGYGHHLLKHQPQETDHYFDDSGAFTKLASSPPQSSAVPMSARKTDIGIPINEMLKKHHGLNSWAILQVLTNHPLYGCPRIQLVQKSSKSGNRRSLKFNVKCAEKVAKRLGIASGYAHHIEDQSNYSKKGCIPKLSFDRQIYHMSVQEKHKLGVPPYTVKAWSEKNHQAIEVDIDNIKFIPARDKKLYDTTSQNSEPSQSTLAANMAPPQSQSTTIYTGENASWAIFRLRELLWSMEHSEEEQTFLQSIKVLINLGVWYYIRFHSTNSTSDLDYAISCHHRGYTLLMRKNPGSQVAAQAALADSSIASDEEKLSASGKELELRKAETKLLLCFAVCQSNYRRLLVIRYQWRKHNEDIELAISLLLGAYRLIQIHSDDTFLRRIRELAGCPNDSREIFIGENLLPLDALGDLQSLILSNYAQALLKKYETHRSLSVLDEAVFSQERALASKKALTGKVSMRFSQQGLLYLQRAEYFLSSSPAQSTLDLYWAFVAVEKALRNMQDHFSSVTPRDEVLSQALDLCQTGVHVGEFSSYDEVSRRLEEAFAYVRQSLEMRLSQTGNWQPSWWFRDTLARLHYIHFRLSNSNTHIRQALDEQNKALQLMTPDQNERSISISRYRVLLVKGISILKPGEVDIAIQEQRDALRSLLTMDADRHSYLHDLGLLLCKRFLLRPIGPLDIDEAITVQSDAMRMMPENDSELMATRLYDMSNSYYARFSLLSQINEKSIDNAILNMSSLSTKPISRRTRGYGVLSLSNGDFFATLGCCNQEI